MKITVDVGVISAVQDWFKIHIKAPEIHSEVANDSISLSFHVFNPSACGHLNPSSYCDVGRLFYGVFKLWSKLQRKK